MIGKRVIPITPAPRGSQEKEEVKEEEEEEEEIFHNIEKEGDVYVDKDSEGIETEEESSSINLDDIIQKFKEQKWENQRKREVEGDEDIVYPAGSNISDLSEIEGGLFDALTLEQLKDSFIGLAPYPAKYNSPSPTLSQTPSCSSNPPINPYPQSPRCSKKTPPKPPFRTYGRT